MKMTDLSGRDVLPNEWTGQPVFISMIDPGLVCFSRVSDPNDFTDTPLVDPSQGDPTDDGDIPIVVEG